MSGIVFIAVVPATPQRPAPPTNPNQHCVAESCGYTFSHTAKWCGTPQTRRCCHWCYPEGLAVTRDGV